MGNLIWWSGLALILVGNIWNVFTGEASKSDIIFTVFVVALVCFTAGKIACKP
jgi:hypothetical protein